MSVTARASEVKADFEAFQERALVEPVRVVEQGRETVFIISAETFHALKQRQRVALLTSDLTDAEAALIAETEIPPEHRYSIEDLD